MSKNKTNQHLRTRVHKCTRHAQHICTRAYTYGCAHTYACKHTQTHACTCARTSMHPDWLGLRSSIWLRHEGKPERAPPSYRPAPLAQTHLHYSYGILVMAPLAQTHLHYSYGIIVMAPLAQTHLHVCVVPRRAVPSSALPRAVPRGLTHNVHACMFACMHAVMHACVPARCNTGAVAFSSSPTTGFEHRDSSAPPPPSTSPAQSPSHLVKPLSSYIFLL